MSKDSLEKVVGQGRAFETWGGGEMPVNPSLSTEHVEHPSPQEKASCRRPGSNKGSSWGSHINRTSAKTAVSS